MPTVSAIIPNHNHAKFLKAGVSSISSQNFQNFTSNNSRMTAHAIQSGHNNSFNTIFNRSPWGNLILTTNLTITQCNQAFGALMGVNSSDNVVGASILQFAHPNFLADWQLIHHKIWVQHNTSVTHETCMIRPNGTSFWSKITVVLFESGSDSLGYTVIEDISAQKTAETACKKSEANLRTILHHSNSSYILFNSQLNILSFNTLAKKFTDVLYSKTLLQGGYLLDYFPPERQELVKEITTRVINGENVHYEIAINTAQGKYWMDVAWLNVKSPDNKSWEFILAGKNITESKLSATEREKLTVDLIQRNKALEQFTNIASHNLRAPVANIIGLVELIEDTKMDLNETTEILESIHQSAKNLDAVITDINDILQVKELLNNVKESVRFKQLVADIKTSISGMIAREHVTITCNFDNAPDVMSIRSYLYSIFYNIILNSIKYRRLDINPHIILSSRMDNNNLVLSFKDNGKGIDLQKNGDNLFGLYKRFDNTVQGRGLGLFMVKSQVESLGGSITITSQLGQSTEFIVKLPINI